VAIPSTARGAKLKSRKKVGYSVERSFGERRIGPQLWKQKVVGSYHIADRRRRAGQLRQDEIERFADQREAVGRRGKRKAKF
jgi:hypothetical protein